MSIWFWLGNCNIPDDFGNLQEPGLSGMVKTQTCKAQPKIMCNFPNMKTSFSLDTVCQASELYQCKHDKPGFHLRYLGKH